MPQILFVDHKHKIDWSNFSVAGNVRAQHGKATTPVSMIGKSDLSTLDPGDVLYLSAHGSSESSGKFNDAKVLAEKLQTQGLQKTHQSIVLLTCSAAVQPDNPHVKSFAVNLKTELQALKYGGITVEGGRGFVVYFPHGKEAVRTTAKTQAIVAQQKTVALNQWVVNACVLRAQRATSNATAEELGQASDEIAAFLSKFYADLALAFNPFLMSADQAFVKY